MPIGAAEPWKRLTVLNGQTVLETTRPRFPDVRAATRFEVRWLDDAGKAIGQTPRELKKRAARLTERGVNVVLIMSAVKERADSQVRAPIVVANAGRGRIVMAPMESLAGLTNNPLAQEALLQYARLAVNPNLLTDTDP